MLNVRIWATGAEGENPTEVEDVTFVSLVNDETFGAPPLIAPTTTGDGARAEVGDAVLYINTSVIAAFEIERQG